MRLFTFKTSDGLKLGLKTGTGVIDISDLPGGMSPDAFFAGGLDSLAALQQLVAAANADPLLDADQLTLGPAVPHPGKILCVGLNYRQHALESGMAIPTTPVLFSKFANAVAAPDEPVPLPAYAEQYDYEAELAVVIGRRARNVPESGALNHVLGYCNANDLSARDLQFLTGQWLLGKTLDRFMPIGPDLVTADEILDPQALAVRCWLNDELRQDSTTADMVFSVAEIVSYASRYMTLEPGDVILTGTPEGVIFGMPEKVWVKPGDTITVEIGDLGRLTNTLIAAEEPGT